METLKFVDAFFNEISPETDKEQRYAVDLGIRRFLAEEWLPADNLHFFLSVIPWIKNADKRETAAFMQNLKRLNPEVTFGLPGIKQIDLLNYLGKEASFKIKNSWTSSSYEDWHGRTDGYYALKDGRTLIDWGETKTDTHIIFGFVPGTEKQILQP